MTRLTEQFYGLNLVKASGKKKFQWAKKKYEIR
jgi:hypothetical protein